MEVQMKQIKRVIILLVIIVIIILTCILILNQKSNTSGEIIDNQAIEENNLNDFIISLGRVNNYSTFASVEQMLNNYINNIYYGNIKVVYNLLNKDYIEKNKITEGNALKNMPEIIKYNQKVKILDIYNQENMENAVYYIKAILSNEEQNKDFYFILYEDKENLTYSVANIEKKVFEEKIIEDKELEYIEIENNENNQSIFINLSEEEIVEKYFEDYIDDVLYYPEYTYSILNQEYKEKCFSTLEEFKEYLEQKRNLYLTYNSENEKVPSDFENVYEYLEYIEELDKLEISKYKIREVNNQKIYLCVDNKDNYYTFYATAPMNYTVMLDNYTIPTEEFVEEYNKSSEAEKVVLNIKRFFMGIDDKNYGFSYNVLSESFKNSKYPTKKDFLNFAKQNFFEENKIEYISYEKENGLYIYKIKLTDATGTSTESKEFNIILKLKSGTDFEMSFGEN
jgi:hypothetical protein